MKLLKEILVGSVLFGALAFGTTSEVKAHDDGGYNPNHAHVCTQSTSLNIRQSPKGKVVGSFNKGYQVQIKASYYNWETNDTWYEVYKPNSDSTGFVSSKFICFN